jgi:uncharacterized RDD family membrane protein YckC
MDVHIARAGQQLGRFTEEQVRSMLAAGEVSPTDLAWRAGLPAWLPLHQVLPGVEAPAVPAEPSPVSDERPAPVLAGRGARLAAAILDSVLVLIPFIPLAILSVNETMGRSGVGAMAQFAFFGLLLVALAITQIVLLATRGQSIGKILRRIRIVSIVDGSNPGFARTCLLRGLVCNLIGAIPWVGWVFSLVDVCFVFRDDRRCVHDLIAGTRVVVTE